MTRRPSLKVAMQSQDDRGSPMQRDVAPMPDVTASKQKPSRVGKKAVVIPLDPAVHRQLKYLSIELDQSMEQIVRDALIRRLKEAGKLTD